jgi:hypothetical protein
MQRSKKAKKQCNALAKTTKLGCKKYALPGSNYCFQHYPKREFVIGMLISLLMPILFHEPLINLLTKIPILYYLDTVKPYISQTVPDFVADKSISPDINAIEIGYLELGSGLDNSRSKIELYMKSGINYVLTQSSAGYGQTGDSTWVFELKEKLKYGQYRLDVSLVDKGSNRLDASYPFVIREADYIKVSTSYCPFDTYKKKALFSGILEDERISFDKYNLFVYTIGLSNGSSNAVLKSINVNISTQSIIFAFEEIGKYKTEKCRSYAITEEASRQFPTGHVFLSHRDVFIEEIGPSGWIGFALLVGEMIDSKNESDVSQHIGIHGNYSCDAYGIQELRHINEWIPMNDNGEVSKQKTLRFLWIK